MDLSNLKFPKLSATDAYQGDLGERYQAVVNQDTFVEICAISNSDDEFHHVGHIAPLKEHCYDLGEFQNDLRGKGDYYLLKTEGDVRAFLGLVAAAMVIERP